MGLGWCYRTDISQLDRIFVNNTRKKKMQTCQKPSGKRGPVLGQGEKEHSDLLGAPPWVYFSCFL